MVILHRTLQMQIRFFRVDHLIYWQHTEKQITWYVWLVSDIQMDRNRRQSLALPVEHGPQWRASVRCSRIMYYKFKYINNAFNLVQSSCLYELIFTSPFCWMQNWFFILSIYLKDEPSNSVWWNEIRNMVQLQAVDNIILQIKRPIYILY